MLPNMSASIRIIPSRRRTNPVLDALVPGVPEWIGTAKGVGKRLIGDGQILMSP